MAAETGKASFPDDTEDGIAVAASLLDPSIEFLALVFAMRIGLAVAFGVSEVFSEEVNGRGDISEPVGEVVLSEEVEGFLFGVCGVSCEVEVVRMLVGGGSAEFCGIFAGVDFLNRPDPMEKRRESICA